MPGRYLLEDTAIDMTVFIKPLGAGVIVHLLFNIQTSLRVLMASYVLP